VYLLRSSTIDRGTSAAQPDNYEMQGLWCARSREAAHSLNEGRSSCNLRLACVTIKTSDSHKAATRRGPGRIGARRIGSNRTSVEPTRAERLRRGATPLSPVFSECSNPTPPHRANAPFFLFATPCNGLTDGLSHHAGAKRAIQYKLYGGRNRVRQYL
jgi:hypothetical protein